MKTAAVKKSNALFKKSNDGMGNQKRGRGIKTPINDKEKEGECEECGRLDR